MYVNEVRCVNVQSQHTSQASMCIHYYQYRQVIIRKCLVLNLDSDSCHDCANYNNNTCLLKHDGLIGGYGSEQLERESGSAYFWVGECIFR